MSQFAIELNDVDKRFGERKVLDALNFKVHAGECVALVGGNGAGKTTSIKCMLDLQPLDAGAIRLFGLTHRSPRSRNRIAFLPERFVPPQYLSGLEFLRYVQRLRGLDAAPEALIHRAERFELPATTLRQPVHTYSKGMAQKLGLVACIDSGKDLMILDEPMSGLDARARIALKSRLSELSSAGVSVLFTTHSLLDAEHIGHRLAILHQGRIVFAGTPAKCREHYGANSLEDAFLSATAPQAGSYA